MAVTWTFGFVKASQFICRLLNLDQDPLCSGDVSVFLRDQGREAQGRWGSHWLSSNLSVPSCWIRATTSLMPGKLLASFKAQLLVSSQYSIHCRVYEEEGRVIG